MNTTLMLATASNTGTKIMLKDDLKKTFARTIKTLAEYSIPTIDDAISGAESLGTEISKSAYIRMLAGHLKITSNKAVDVLLVIKKVLVEFNSQQDLISSYINEIPAYTPEETSVKTLSVITLITTMNMICDILPTFLIMSFNPDAEFPAKKKDSFNKVVDTFIGSIVYYNTELKPLVKSLHQLPTNTMKVIGGDSAILNDVITSALNKITGFKSSILNLSGFINNPFFHIGLLIASNEVKLAQKKEAEVALLKTTLLKLMAEQSATKDQKEIDALETQIRYYQSTITQLEAEISRLKAA